MVADKKHMNMFYKQIVDSKYRSEMWSERMMRSMFTKAIVDLPDLVYDARIRTHEENVRMDPTSAWDRRREPKCLS